MKPTQALHSALILPFILLPLLPILASSAAADQSLAGRNLSEIWQLGAANFTKNNNTKPWGQNFTLCCINAIIDAVEDNNNTLEMRSGRENWIQFKGQSSALPELFKYSERGQFPCTAVYNDDDDGAPIVSATYVWVVQNCPGWALSGKANLNAWLQPLSSFLIPAAVFCLSIPRRRRLEVPRRFFAPNQDDIRSYLLAPFGAAMALFIAILDTIIWLCVCFAFAGPMIISGLYEAMLDNYVLEYLKHKIDDSRLTLDMRCRCLMAILIGNLDLVWNTDTDNNSGGYADDQAPLASPWQHMEKFLYKLRLYDDDKPLRGHSPLQYAQHGGQWGCPPGKCLNVSHYGELPIQRTQETAEDILRVKTQLKTMLHCQYSFGSIVGAPVIFFLGGFAFALAQSMTALGDESTSLALAFGQWYMTIPHISIVSSLLLAGNNPNILEGVLAVNPGFHKDGIKFLGLAYGLAYPSCYKVAWLWNRGHNKKQWINTLTETYSKRKNDNYNYADNQDPVRDIEQLEIKTTLSLLDWIILLSLAILLFGVPNLLAFFTAFYTPETGVSCRSLTFTIYFIIQLCQIILWLWAYAGPLDTNGRKQKFFFSDGWLDQRSFYQPYDLHWISEVPRNPTKLLHEIRINTELRWKLLWNLLYYLSQWALGVLAIFAAIGGTLMQLLGVYTADICRITASYWHRHNNEHLMVVLSLNTHNMIHQARDTWMPCAVAAIFFMAFVSFFGWWYQRRMRDIFTDQVRRIDQNEYRERFRSI